MPPVNLRHDAYDVYIGRPGPWRNPFRIGPDGNRAKVIAKYARWLLQQVRQGKITTQQLAGLHLTERFDVEWGFRYQLCHAAPCVHDYKGMG